MILTIGITTYVAVGALAVAAAFWLLCSKEEKSTDGHYMTDVNEDATRWKREEEARKEQLRLEKEAFLERQRREKEELQERTEREKDPDAMSRSADHESLERARLRKEFEETRRKILERQAARERYSADQFDKKTPADDPDEDYLN